jgi:N-acetylneuraminate lyase
MSEFIEKAALQMPNFAGIKYTFEDLDDYRFCIEYMNGKYDILWGRDEMLLQALGKGAAGAVGSTYNYAAPLYYRIIGLFREGRIDEAGVLQKKAVQMIGLLEKYGGIGTGKAFMKYIGFDCGKYRMPVKNLTDRSYLSFVRDADALGLKNLFSVTGNA